MVVRVPLTHGLFALVSDEDAALVERYAWHVAPRGRITITHYAVANIPHEGVKRVKVYMHRLILAAQRGEFVDHIDHDGLNNQRDNLRKVTQAKNSQNSRLSSRNTSGFKGVCFDQSKGHWLASIRIAGKNRFLGYYRTPAAAGAAYAEAAKQAYNEFAHVPNEHATVNTPRRKRTDTSVSGITGVCWDGQRRKWKAYAYTNKIQVYLGHHPTKEAAGEARREYDNTTQPQAINQRNKHRG